MTSLVKYINPVTYSVDKSELLQSGPWDTDTVLFPPHSTAGGYVFFIPITTLFNIPFPLRHFLLLVFVTFLCHLSLPFLLLLDRVLISVTTLAICLSYPQLKLSHSVFIAAFIVTWVFISITIVVIVSLFFVTFSLLFIVNIFFPLITLAAPLSPVTHSFMGLLMGF